MRTWETWLPCRCTTQSSARTAESVAGAQLVEWLHAAGAIAVLASADADVCLVAIWLQMLLAHN